MFVLGCAAECFSSCDDHSNYGLENKAPTPGERHEDAATIDHNDYIYTERQPEEKMLRLQPPPDDGGRRPGLGGGHLVRVINRTDSDA